MCTGKYPLRNKTKIVDNELSFEEIKKIVKKINQFYWKKPQFLITGGEPFLNKDIIEILSFYLARILHTLVCIGIAVLLLINFFNIL